jgi:hypothetical protein
LSGRSIPAALIADNGHQSGNVPLTTDNLVAAPFMRWSMQQFVLTSLLAVKCRHGCACLKEIPVLPL